MESYYSITVKIHFQEIPRYFLKKSTSSQKCFLCVDITVGADRIRPLAAQPPQPYRTPGRQLGDPPFPGVKHPCNTLSGEPRRLRRTGAFHTFLCNSKKSTIDYRPLS